MVVRPPRWKLPFAVPVPPWLLETDGDFGMKCSLDGLASRLVSVEGILHELFVGATSDAGEVILRGGGGSV